MGGELVHRSDHSSEFSKRCKSNSESFMEPFSVGVIEHRSCRSALAEVLGAKKIVVISIVCGDTIAVRPFSNRSIDFLLFGPRARLSKKRNERSIASDFRLYFAGDLSRLGAAQAARFNGRHNVAVSLKTTPNLVLISFKEIAAAVWIIDSDHADARSPSNFMPS